MERSGDPAADDLIGAEPRDPLALELDLPTVALQDAEEHVKECRLPGPVRTDDGMELALTDGQIHSIYRGQGAEPLHQTPSRQDRLADHARFHRGMVSLGP